MAVVFTEGNPKPLSRACIESPGQEESARIFQACVIEDCEKGTGMGVRGVDRSGYSEILPLLSAPIYNSIFL